MKKKYIFFDIDGTLTDKRTGQIVPSAKKQFKNYKIMDILYVLLLEEHTIKQSNLLMRLGYIILLVMVVRH